MSAPERGLLGAVPARSAACEAVITRIAASLEPQVEEIAEQLIDRVVLEMEFDSDDLELREDLIAAACGSVRLITVMARSWTDPHIVPPPQDAISWARSLVARRLPAEAIIRVYRIGQAGYHEAWINELAACGAEEPVVIEAIRAVSAFVFTWVDAIFQPLLDAYHQELAKRVSGAQAMRAETIALALSGEPFDQAAASARLRYELGRRHLALIAWTEPDAGDEAHDAIEIHTAAAAAVLAPAQPAAPLIHRD